MTTTCQNCPPIQERLDEANNAYHQLMTGTQAASISTSGETVTYNTGPASVTNLKRYIAEMNRELAACPTCQNHQAKSKTGLRRAFKPAFGG